MERRDLALELIIDALDGQGRFQSALEVADRIKDARGHMEALLGLALALDEAGNHSQANAVIRKAHQVAQGMQDADTRNAALLDVPRYFAWTGSTENAIAVVREIQ